MTQTIKLGADSPDLFHPGFGGVPAEPYVARRVDFAVVFTPAGHLMGVHALRGPDGERPTVWLPRQRTGGEPAFLWSKAKTFSEAGGRRPRAALSGAFAAFRDHNLRGLGEESDAAIRAFGKMLLQWDPHDLALRLPGLDRGNAAVVFRFQYDDEFLHARNAARRIWRRLYSFNRGPD